MYAESRCNQCPVSPLGGRVCLQPDRSQKLGPADQLLLMVPPANDRPATELEATRCPAYVPDPRR